LGKVKPVPKVKLICGMLSSNEELLLKITEELSKKWGEADNKSEIMDFSHTNYYKDEMGENIKRLFVSFKNLVSPSFLVDAKLLTQEIEAMYVSEGRRIINLDPGYICEGKLVLASTKNHQHRIYMDRGIYAEVTLRFVDRHFTSWEWTYPDYKTEEYITYFTEVRNLLRRQLGRKMVKRSRHLQKSNNNNSNKY